jgi:hypothetical protein
VPISIPKSLVVALPPILSPSFRTFVELTLINWRRPWGSRRLDFVIRAGSFKFFSSIRSANFTVAHNRSSQIDSTEFIINISYRLHHQDLQRFAVKNRRVRSNRRIAGAKKIDLHIVTEILIYVGGPSSPRIDQAGDFDDHLQRQIGQDEGKKKQLTDAHVQELIKSTKK